MSPACSPAFAAGPSGAIECSTTAERMSSPAASATRRGSATVSTPTPSQARCTPPWRRISLTTKRTVLLATAKQMPCAPRIIAVLMPMTAPADDTSAPPELPGLSAASVWITSSIGRPLRDASERPSAETTPAVTVESKPSGLPIATAIWPRLSVAAVAEHGRRQAGAMRLEQRQVGVGIGAEQLGAHPAAVGEGDFERGRAVDHVMVGDDQPVRRDGDAGAHAAALRDDGRDGRADAVGDRRDRAGIGVEQLAVGGRRVGIGSGKRKGHGNCPKLKSCSGDMRA